MDTLGPTCFGVIWGVTLLLYRSYTPSDVRLYCHGLVGTTEPAL